MSEPGTKLELVQVLFRHGARTCIRAEALALPQHIDRTLHETYGYEQLTKDGKAQMHKLGRALRARYDGFLGPDYRPKDLCARSTDFDRSKMSLQLVLAGLYPPSAEQSFCDGLAWMPLPFYTVPKQLDFLLLMFDKQRYKDLLQVTRNSIPNKQESPEALKIRLFFEGKEEARAFEKSPVLGALSCYNVLNTHKTANCPLPAWYTEDIYATLRERVIGYLDAMSASTELKKTLSGPMVRRVLENMDVEGEMDNPRKVYLYSGHEFNVAAFLRAHGIEDMRYPDFGSAVVVEKLRDSQGRLYVRMLAWTGKDEDFFGLKLNGRDDICPIEEYLEIVADVVPSDDEMDAMYKECSLDLRRINATDPALGADYLP